jgi:hypothetical protein
VLGRTAFPRVPIAGPARHAGRRNGTVLAMATAGTMSLLVSELARHSDPHLCGLVAAVPLVGMCATVAGYREGGAGVMLRVLAGYLDGMAAKAAFLAALGAAWMLGAGAWAWLLALAAATFALLAQHRLARLPARTQATRRT